MGEANCRMIARALILLLIQVVTAAAETFSFATMNCYWFLGAETNEAADKPRTTEEYSLKAGHLIGLLPQEPPLFVGLQEIGNDQDVQALAYSASRRYKHDFKPLFVQGRDTATKQDVGALFDTSRGWGVHGKASRVSELDKELTKHLVVRITNALAHIDVCVVHLRRPIGADGIAKQNEQNLALLRWSMRHLAKDPAANLIIVGDFNEGSAVGSPSQSLAVLFQAAPPLVDVFDHFKGKPVTHTAGKAFDRIIISDGLLRGTSRLKFSGVEIMSHGHGKGEDRRMYTDHYPVIVRFLQTSQGSR